MNIMINLLLAGVLTLGSAQAAPVQAPHVAAELVAESGSIKPGGTAWVGVRFQMEPGWHIYWRNPGDSGTPTTISWKLPPGAKIDAVQWPRPERMEEGDMVTYGYSGTLLLMARLTVPANIPTDQVLKLGATSSWLVCKDMCVPGKVELALDLPVGQGQSGANAGLFSRTRANIPGPVPSGWSTGAYAHGGKLFISLSGTGKLPGKPVIFIPLVADQISNTAPQSLALGNKGWTLSLIKSDLLTSLPRGITGVLISGAKSWELNIPLGKQAAPATPLAGPAVAETADIGLLWACLFAFMGGIILNLMPCVFPVLSIKVLGFVRESSHHPREVRLHGLLYGLGVIVMFWVLALALILLRAGGQQLGWGFQLQSPAIILLLAVILFLLSLNLMGVFEMGTTIVRATGKFSWSEGRVGAFFTGVLATVLATPCTAPFMGTAVGYAATQPMLAGMGIFTSMGIGMAIPYVALSFMPRLGHYLPKPGRWMETFKQLMAFPLLATVIWLLWVLGLQAGLVAVISGLGCLFIAGMAGWLYGRWHTNFMRVVAVAMVIGGVMLGIMGVRAGVPLGAAAVVDEWAPFTRARLEQALSTGAPVFVDFTAAWCLTCKVNELGALSTAGVKDAFRRNKVVLLRADWTNSNPEIEKALAAFGRNGVPLYLLYPGGKVAIPRVLPQILTPQIILRELENLTKRG